MATTVPALGDKQLEAELQTQKRELDRLHDTLGQELRKLEALNAERNRVVDAIERGVSGKESDLHRAKVDCESAEIRVGGLKKLVASIEEKIRELTEELNRRQVEAAKAARQKAFIELQEDTAADANAIVRDLVTLTEKLAAFDAKRIRLGLEFPDLGGAAAADRVAEMLFRNSGPKEKLRDPNTHNRLLEDRGWVFAGKPGPSFARIPSAIHQYGNALQLTVQSMRPKE